MKRLLFAGLSVMLLSAVAVAPASAQTRIDRELMSYNRNVAQGVAQSDLTPFDLAFLAYRGYLGDQGIQSYGVFVEDYVSGKVTAKNIVEAAIKANRLPESKLNDRAYLHSLDNIVRELELR